MTLDMRKSLRTMSRCSGNGWIMGESTTLLQFLIPMLGWGGLDTPKFPTSNMSWSVFSPLALMHSLSHFCPSSNEILSILPKVVIISWSFEGDILVSLVIWFEPLSSFTSNSSSSCGISKTEHSKIHVFACYYLGIGPTLDLPSFVKEFSTNLSDVFYCIEVLAKNL